MNTRKIFFTLAAAALLAVLILHVTRTPAARAAASEQVVFSGTGVFTDDAAPAPITPFGFWIWCEGASANPYQGECSGAMYFYAFGITKGVLGSVSGSGQQFTMTVHSADGVIACTLKNGPTVVSGPANMVTATCTAPSQVVDTADNDTSGLSTNAVVSITGPGN
jgi:hypothetical protein